MGTLKCSLSPLVFAELYRLLNLANSHQNLLDDRLSAIGYSFDWLQEAAQTYESKWVSTVEYISPDLADESALPPEHALLATWLLASLRNTGDSYGFSADLLGAVQERMNREAPLLKDKRPLSLAPSVRGWTLGKSLGSNDSALPMVPAAYPNDPHITAAYEGLIEHLLYLNGISQPWPELAGTALLVRTGGLAEALQPPPDPPPRRGLDHSINLLMSEARRHMPDSLRERLTKNWVRWVERRNVLTHIMPNEDAKFTFTESAELVRTWEQIEMTVLGITQFLCQQVSQELLDWVPPPLRTDPWDSYLRREVQTEW